MSVGLGILYFVFQNQEAKYLEDCVGKGTPAEQCSLVDKIIDDFRSVNYWWILVVFACYLASNVSRAMRWQMLLRPLGGDTRFSNVFSAVMIGYFGNLGLPRLGEVLRAVTVSTYEKIPVEKVVGTVIVERLMDVVSLLICIGLCFIFEFDTIYEYVQESQSGEGGSNLKYLILAIGVVGLAIAWVFKKQLLALPIFQKLFRIAKGFLDGILSIGKMDKPFRFIAHSVFIWVMYFMMTYVCFFAFEPTAHLSAVAGLMAFVVGSLAIVVPSPGGMGTYHIFIIALLSTRYGISEADAFSYANIIFFSIQLGINVTIGLLALLALPIMNRNYEPTSTGA